MYFSEFDFKTAILAVQFSPKLPRRLFFPTSAILKDFPCLKHTPFFVFPHFSALFE
ncbi:hypothetical protein LguiA_013392 [Lonicera macranthoides]